MFPALSDLFAYLFHIHLQVPVQTLGFFVVVAFIACYMDFTAEFKRKEAQGLIHGYKRKLLVGQPVSIPELGINAIIGFLFGFKIVGAIINYAVFINNPKSYMLSIQGNLLTGLLCGAGWTYWAYIDRKKEQLAEPIIIEETVHPYQLMVRISFWAGLIGLIGAKLFDVVEHIGYFWANPLNALLSTSGYAYYGAFFFGMLTFFYIGVKNGIRLAHMADIGAPGMMLAYGVGRIGCQLSGDGDWGIVNVHIKPGWLHLLPDWMWAFKYPHNVLNTGIYIPGCAGNYCSVLARGVYPTPFYESVICIGLFIIFFIVRKYMTMPGLMSMTYLITAGAERFFIEFIRVNIHYNVFGFSLTQAQILAIISMTIGFGGVVYMYTPVRRYLPKWLIGYFYKGGAVEPTKPI